MVLNWVLYVGLGVLAYIGISLMGQLGGASAASATQALVNAYRPLTLFVMLVANGIWIAALFYGMRETRTALPMLLAIGDIVGFAYAVYFFGAEVTPLRVGGLVLILAGIYLLA